MREGRREGKTKGGRKKMEGRKKEERGTEKEKRNKEKERKTEKRGGGLNFSKLKAGKPYLVKIEPQ